MLAETGWTLVTGCSNVMPDDLGPITEEVVLGSILVGISDVGERTWNPKAQLYITYI